MMTMKVVVVYDDDEDAVWRTMLMMMAPMAEYADYGDASRRLRLCVIFLCAGRWFSSDCPMYYLNKSRKQRLR